MDKTITDKRFLKSKQAIENSLVSLYESGKAFSTITISELTKLAKIARKTFYLHYVDLNDFINQYIQEKVDNVSQSFLYIYNMDFTTDLANFFVSLTNLILENKLAFMLIKTPEYATIILNYLKQSVKVFMSNHPDSPLTTDYGKEFFSSGIVSTYRYWINRAYNTGLKPTYEEDIKNFITIASNNLSSLTM